MFGLAQCNQIKTFEKPHKNTLNEQKYLTIFKDIGGWQKFPLHYVVKIELLFCDPMKQWWKFEIFVALAFRQAVAKVNPPISVLWNHFATQLF